LLPSTIAVTIFLEAAGFFAVAVTLRELCLCVTAGEGVGVAGYNLIDGLGAFHIVTGVLAGLAETGLGRGGST
jgi:hypothetical protein